MPIVSYNGESYDCTKAVKGTNYINLYEGDILSVKFEGVVDFSAFTITEGDWSEPAGAEEVRGAASIVDGMLIIDVADETGDGTLIKFCAPCGCDAITAGTKIGDIVYDIVDAAGNIMTGPGGAWVSGAQVALVLSKSTAKAYLQNSATTDSYTRAQSLSDEVRQTLRLGDTATPADAFEKLSNPLNTLAIGDLFHSANNIEEMTNGAFIKMDGRTIDRKNGYPDLADVWELKYRIADPVKVNVTPATISGTTNTITWAQDGGDRYNGVAIGNVYFWISQYGTSTSNTNVLHFCNSEGVVTSLISEKVSRIVECNGYLLAFVLPGSSAYIYVHVYDTSGNQVRKVTLSANKYAAWVGVHIEGNMCFCLARYSTTTYGWYSDDCFATYGTTTWSTATKGSVLTNDPYAMPNIQKGSDGHLYICNQYNTTTPAYQLYVYRSTNSGKSFDLAGTYPSSTTSTQFNDWFIHNGYLYVFAYDSTNGGRLLKIDLATFKLVASSTKISTSSVSILGGFFYDNCLYAHVNYSYGSSQNFKIDLDTMIWEYWEAYIGLVGGDYYNQDYVTRNGEYWILCHDEALVPTNSTDGEAVYYGILVYHIPSHRAVYLTGHPHATTSYNTTDSLHRPFEKADGKLLFPTGYYYDDELRKSGLIELDFNKITLPIQEYSYIKTREVE